MMEPLQSIVPYKFLNRRKDFLAEALPGGVYRLTYREENQPPLTLMISPGIGRIYFESVSLPAKIESRVTDLQPEKLRFFQIEKFVQEGKEILEENGVPFAEDADVAARLGAIHQKLLDQPPLKVEDLARGELLAVLYEGGFTTFVLEEAERHQDGIFFVGKGAVQALFHPAGTRSMTPVYDGEWLFDSDVRIVRIKPSDKRFVEEMAAFYEADGGPDEGKRWLEEMKHLEAMQPWRASTEETKDPSTRLPEADRLGHVVW